MLNSARSLSIRFPFDRMPERLRPFWTIILPIAAFMLSAGCASKTIDPGLSGPFHKVGNFYLSGQKLPDDIRRVAMLPLVSAEENRVGAAGQRDLEPILYGEMTKGQLFEVILVRPSQLEQWTGRPRWLQSDELPADFLVRIKEETSCDAILFCQLSHFRSYPPLAIGWRLLLVKTDGQLLWSLDELFDAGEPAVVNSMRRYIVDNERSNAEFSREIRTRPGALWSQRVVGLEWLNSPRQFGRYTAHAVVQTLAQH